MLHCTCKLRDIVSVRLVERARGRGKPKRTWFTDIAEWTGIGITACVREAEDRQKWGKIAKSSKCIEGQQRLRKSLVKFS